MTKYKNTYRIESARLKGWDYSIPWWYFVTINTMNHTPYFGLVHHDQMILNDFGKEVENEWKRTQTLRKMVELDYYIIMPNHIHGIIIINGPDVETHRVRLGKNNIHPDDNPIHPADESVRLDKNSIHPDYNPIHPDDESVRLGKNNIHPDDNPINPDDKSVRLGDNRVRLEDGQVHLFNNPTPTQANDYHLYNEFPHIVSNCLSDIIKGFKSSVTKLARERGYTDFAWQSRFYDRIIRNDKELFNIRRYIEQNPCKWEQGRK